MNLTAKHIVGLLLLVPGIPALAQTIKIEEAEKAQVVCKAGKEMGGTIWASGGQVVPAYWGQAAGDSVTWTLRLNNPAKGLKIAVRYSYAADHYRQFSHAENPKRTLHLIVDGDVKHPLPVFVPDTGWWDIFETASVELPELSSGEHKIHLVSPAPHTTTNVDCFIVYRGGPERMPLNLRRTTIAGCTPSSAPAEGRSGRPASRPTGDSPRFVLRVTPKAFLRVRPEVLCRQFYRIYDYYADYMGWTPPPFGINIIEDAKWPNPGASAFQNNYGVWLRAGVLEKEQGNWCHEMTHMFYVAHFPGWFDESSVQCLTVFNWVPALFPSGRGPQDNPTYRAWEADARRFLNAADETTDNMTLIQNAVRVKYGPEVFRKFFHLCAQAGARKEIDFTPGRHLTKAEIVKYMSEAAGEDVTPIYARWRGFSQAP